MIKPSIAWWSVFAATLLWVGALWWLRGELGLVWDEPPLVERHLAMRQWFAECLGLRQSTRPAFSRAALDAGWPFCQAAPHEHPPLQALASLAAHGLLGDALGPIRSIRLATLLGYAVVVATAFQLSANRWGRLAGAATAGFLWFQPRFLGDMQLATFDGLGATTFFLAATAMLQCCAGRCRAGWFGIAAGVAVMTKATGILVVPAMAAWAILFRVRSALRPLLWCVLLGPLTSVALFPGWWTRPIEGPIRWCHAILNYDQHVPTQYFGKTYDQDTDKTPWHKPFVTLAMTTPLPWLLLAVIGWIGSKRGGDPAHCGLRSENAASKGGYSLSFWGWAMAGALAAPIAQAIHLLPGHDGARQLTSAYPFLGVLMGGATAGLCSWMQHWIGRGISTILALTLVGAAAWSTWRVHPYELSFYGAQAGGSQGACRLGMETTYYWDAVNAPVLDWLNQRLEHKAKLILFPPTDVRCFAWYQRWGMLRTDIEILQFDRPEIMGTLAPMLDAGPAYLLFLHREGKYVMGKGANPLTFACLADAKANYELIPSALNVRLLAIFNQNDFRAVWPELEKAIRKPPAMQ